MERRELGVEKCGSSLHSGQRLEESKPQLSLDESSHGDREMSSWPSIEHNLICAGPVEPGLPEDRRHGTTVDVGRAFGGHEVAEGTFGCSHVARISREFI